MSFWSMLIVAGGCFGQGTGIVWSDLCFVYDTVEDRWYRIDGPIPGGGVLSDPGVAIIGDTTFRRHSTTPL
jgi:hypothetical protein